MRIRTLVVLLAFALPCLLPAQKTESELTARLVGKPLYLRGLWGEDNLHFDVSGKLIGNSRTVGFTTGGMDVKSVKLSGDKLVLEGNRAGLLFQDDQPARVALQVPNRLVPGTHDEKMTVEIKAPASGDFGQALDAVFTSDLADLVSALPDYWKPFVTAHLGELQEMEPMDYTPVKKQGTPGMPRIGGGVTAPRVLKQQAPKFNDQARAVRLSGKVLVYLQVDEAGHPQKVRVLKALGMGLDEKAVEATEHYVFAPATRNGTPVTVEMNIEVNFSIY